MNLSTLKKNGFVGQDHSLDISLYEYGIVWKEFKRKTKNTVKGEYLFWFGVGVVSLCGDYDKFDWSYMKPTEFESDFSWATLNDVADYAGMIYTDWINSPYENRICDLVGFYGFENVFGTGYYPQTIGTQR